MPATRQQNAAFRPPWILFLAALSVRLILLTAGKFYVFSPNFDHIAFGSEAGHIARSLLTGRGYSDPFWWGKSGATAWIAPGYPLLLTCVFKLFGIYSNLSGWMVLAVQCVMNAAIAVWMWEIAMRCFSSAAAQWSGWIWALSPTAMAVPLMVPWETSISTGLFIWAFLLTLRLRGIGENTHGFGCMRWAQWGFSWGMIALFNPSILIFLPCAGAWLLAETRVAWRRKAGGAALAAVIFVAMLAPWAVRNERVFNTFILTRGNLGAELCSGNCYGIEGVIGEWVHPNRDPQQMQEYVRVGEVAYNRERMSEFLQVLHADPTQFLKMSLLRLDFYWAGVQRPFGMTAGDVLSVVMFCFTGVSGILGAWLAWRKRRPGASLFLLALLTMPAVYYFVATLERFRYPLEPLLYLLGAWLFSEAKKSFSVRWFSRREPSNAQLSMVRPSLDLTSAT